MGCGDGEGTTLNIPLPGGSGDYAMKMVFDEVIVPCAQRFKPDIILVSAGWVSDIEKILIKAWIINQPFLCNDILLIYS